MNILITGSEGLVGTIVSKELSKEHQIISIDNKIKGRDILKNNLTPYFEDADMLIHLAIAYLGIFKPKQAQKNIDISKKVIEYCENSNNLRKIINASSINVYPYFDIYDKGEKIAQNTPLSQNVMWGEGKYGENKIIAENMFKKYCNDKKIPLLNLRLGCITPDNKISRQKDGSIHPLENDIWLKHEGLIKTIDNCVNTNIKGDYVCVSKKGGLVDSSIRFPI